MTATTYKVVKKRHPWRGLFFGFIFGVGLFMMAILYGWYWVGQYTPWILLVLGVVLGFLISYLPRPWGNKPPPEPAATAAAMPPPSPPTPVEPQPPVVEETVVVAATSVEADPEPDPESYAPPRSEQEP